MTEFDVAIVGGGINGTGIARAAAYRGYRTLLLEKDDFAQATSSQSTKMIHGGIRYLETGDFHLVYEALHERATLLRIAPNLVRPLKLVIPIYRGAPRPPWMVRMGTFLYDLLAGRQNLARSRFLKPAELDALDGLRRDGLRAAIAYSDAQVFDSRLCLENALSAREAGATVLNHHPTESVVLEEGRYHLLGRNLRTGAGFRYSARAVVNATGPWTPFFERRSLGHPTKPMVYDRGIHLVIPSLGLESGLVLMNDDRRLIFVLPWQDDYTLIGTTESRFEGEDFTDVPVSEAEVDYLLDVFNRFFPRRGLRREEVLHYYSGVRTLVTGQELALARVSREADIRVFSDAPGTAWVIVYGGKLTSYRALAEQALDKLAAHVPAPAGDGHRRTDQEPLYGGGPIRELPSTPAFLTPELRAAWQTRYGSRWTELVRRVEQEPGLAEMVVERFRFTRADLAYMVTDELAFTPDDIALRRTKMGYALTDAEQERLSGQLQHLLETR